MKLPFPILLAAEKAIDAVLQMDPETRQSLDALNGKSVRVNITRPGLSVLLLIVDNTIQLAQPDDDGGMEESADTIITGELLALRSLLDGNEAVYQRQVSIEGDIGTSAQLKQIIAGLDPDWQDAISPYLGDGLTHRLDVLQSDFKRWLQRTRQSTRHNTSEYLQEEAELVAPNSEVRQLCDEVDDVRAAVDRLSVRVQRLENAHQSDSHES